MRKLFALVFLVALAVGVWYAGQWFAHHGEVKATVVFKDSGTLRPGDPVIEKQVAVGRVTRIDPFDDRKAVTLRLSRDHRTAIVTDSLFSIDGRSLLVTNTFAVGRPVEDGAILSAREDRLGKWLAKAGPSVQPYVDKARSKAGEVAKEAPGEAKKLKEDAKKWWEKVKK
jgi:hypothetical protein